MLSLETQRWQVIGESGYVVLLTAKNTSIDITLMFAIVFQCWRTPLRYSRTEESCALQRARAEPILSTMRPMLRVPPDATRRDAITNQRVRQSLLLLRWCLLECEVKYSASLFLQSCSRWQVSFQTTIDGKVMLGCVCVKYFMYVQRLSWLTRTAVKTELDILQQPYVP